MSLDLLGAHAVGFDLSSIGPLLQSAGELTKGGVELYQKEEASKKASADERKNLEAAIAADVAASKAAAEAALPSATDATKQAASLAAAAQDRAGAKLSADSQTKRADAADKELNTVMAKWKARPDDASAGALVKAWQTTSTKAHSGSISVRSDDGERKGKKGERESSGGIGALLTKKVVGPVPVWGLGVGAVAAALVAKKYWLKR